MAALAAAPGGAVVACSALARRYRDAILAAAPDAFFVHLDVPGGVLEGRMTGRPGHFMPPGLLRSQLETLEPLDPDEAGATIDGTGVGVVDRAIAALAGD